MTEFLPIDPSKVPLHPFERRGWITTQLGMRNLSQGKLALKLNVSRQTLNQALTAPKSERVEAGIAEALGLKPHELFPERYTADGSRLHRTLTAEALNATAA